MSFAGSGTVWSGSTSAAGASVNDLRRVIDK
jgi:hypothetical protein